MALVCYRYYNIYMLGNCSKLKHNMHGDIVSKSQSKNYSKLISYCNNCPIKKECLELGQELKPRVGIWGGVLWTELWKIDNQVNDEKMYRQFILYLSKRYNISYGQRKSLYAYYDNSNLKKSYAKAYYTVRIFKEKKYTVYLNALVASKYTAQYSRRLLSVSISNYFDQRYL